MAKTDTVLARIDADIAHLKGIEAYAQTHGDNAALLEVINHDIVKLQEMRAYVTNSGEANVAPKVRKPRGKNKPKPGLPASDDAHS